MSATHNLPNLCIVTPCYNEEDVLPSTNAQLVQLLNQLIGAGKIAGDSNVVYVDDGSRDATWRLITDFATQDTRVRGIKLSRNTGHQNALLAGLLHAQGDAIISIDADLQDDLGAIETMIDAYTHRGADVVYGVRVDRSTDSAFKRATAQVFYRVMTFLGADMVENHADFRLMSRRAIESLRDFREVNLFLRGLVPMVGYRSEVVEYQRKKRLAGVSKYPLAKMLSFAFDGITSLSSFPLRLITYIGLGVFLLTVFLSLWTLYIALLTDRSVPGWASTVLPLYFIGGVQILCVGIIGEYAGKIYKEVKARPRYIVERMTDARGS